MATKKKAAAAETETETEDRDEEREERGPQTVDRSRFLDLQRRHRKMAERVSELEGLVAELEPKAATVDQLTEKLKGQEKTFASERSTWEMDGILRDAGITDAHGRTTAKALYNELPEQNRPKIDAWVAELKKDPAKAPKPLQAYFTDTQGGQQSQGAQGQAGGQQGAQRPNPASGVVGGATGQGSGAPTQAEIAAARNAALSGDRGAWDALQARMGFQPLPKFGA